MDYKIDPALHDRLLDPTLSIRERARAVFDGGMSDYLKEVATLAVDGNERALFELQVSITPALICVLPLSHVHICSRLLRYLDLSGANFCGAMLGFQNLEEANLEGADLPEAIMVLTKLSNAKLCHANLTGAILNVARLDGADLTDADLTDADLRAAVLNGARLDGARLDGADLRNATKCDLNQIIQDAASISGLIITPIQAGSLDPHNYDIEHLLTHLVIMP